MARTGIQIRTTDTVLGAPIDVNTNSMLIVNNATGFTDSEAETAFTPNIPYLLTSPEDLVQFGDFDRPENSGMRAIPKIVEDFYYPFGRNAARNNIGTNLWLVGVELSAEYEEDLALLVKQTTVNDFNLRPRQLAIVDINDGDRSTDLLLYTKVEADWGGDLTFTSARKALELLAEDGIRCVAVIGAMVLGTDAATTIGGLGSLTDTEVRAPFVGCTPINAADGADCIYNRGGALVLGTLTNISVASSIGDTSLPSLPTDLAVAVADKTPIVEDDPNFIFDDFALCTGLSKTQIADLSDKQYIFARTRPPRNGLWWNGGSTANDPDNALCTLEAGRTICSIADDLQAFFTSYINTRVPVTSTGDIQSTYKQVVLDNARAAVVQKYIENGDISDARINLVAKDNDMIGTRTWEVTLSILPAPTLRWIDGYVFYVKSL